MRLRNRWSAVVALGGLVWHSGMAWSATCQDVAERGVLNVLTINLLFAEVQTRDERLREIAAFAAENEVDVILLQEVVAGFLADTSNSAEDLQGMLEIDEGLDYELRTAFEAGVRSILAVANATLSRCEILHSAVRRLPPGSEPTVEGEVLPIPRNVLMTRLRVPDVGRITVYNTHLCAGCDSSERATQIDEMLEFVDRSEQIRPSRPVILGGDFNLDIFEGDDERAAYDRILAAGFTDAYAAATDEPLEELCEDPEVPDEHCTLGVSPLSNRIEISRDLVLGTDLPILDRVRLDVPLSADIPLTEEPPAARVDYIFTRNIATVTEAEVVFNPLVPGREDEPAISDHGGVLVRLAVP